MFLFGKDKDKSSSKKGNKKDDKWGKKERFIVFIVLFLTVGTSGVLALSARNWKLPGLPRIKAPSFSSPFGEKTIVIEGNKRDREKAEAAVSGFVEATNELSGVYALYVVRLDNGSSYGVNEFEIMQAASLVKLPVMAAFYKEAEEGNIDLGTEYSLKEEDKTGGSGSLEREDAGYSLTYKELIRLMGKESDNTAFSASLRILGEETIDSMIAEIGMTNTSIEKNTTTPYDVGLFFEGLWNTEFLSETSRDELLEFMTDTAYEKWVAAGTPSDIRVAHKYGAELHTLNDAGIVFAERPFVIVIMSDGVIVGEANETFPELTRQIYDIEVK